VPSYADRECPEGREVNVIRTSYQFLETFRLFIKIKLQACWQCVLTGHLYIASNSSKSGVSHHNFGPELLNTLFDDLVASIRSELPSYGTSMLFSDTMNLAT
jgi:hypothetical protein